MIKALFVIATLDQAGAEKAMVDLVTNLDRDRFDPEVICLTRGGPYEEHLRRANVPCRILGKRRKFSLGVIRTLARHLREGRFDLVHTWMFTANAFGRAAARRAKTPVVIASERCEDVWKKWVHRAIDRHYTKHTDLVLANAEAVKRFCVERIGLPAERIEVIPNGIDLSPYACADAAGVAAAKRGELELADGQPVVGTVGRLAPQKGLDYLIPAMKRVREEFPDAVLLLAGEGPERARLEALARSEGLAGAVRFLGLRMDVPELLRAFDVFVLASTFEGMPNVVLEAMACGRPVVATAVSGTPEVVVEGETGLLVPPRRPEALASAMIDILREPSRARSMGRAGRQRIEERFTLQQVVRRYEDVYERLVSAKRSG